MLAFHPMPVPKATTPTPAPIQGGGTGAFGAQLAAFTTPGPTLSDDLANSTALGTSLSAHKLSKLGDGTGANQAATLVGTAAVAAPQTVSAAANSNVANGASDGGSKGTVIAFTNGNVPLFTGKPSAATSQLAAALGTGTTVALTAPTAADQTNAASTSAAAKGSLPAAAQAAANAFALPPALAAQAQANAQTKAASPPTVTTSQLGAAVATSAAAPATTTAISTAAKPATPAGAVTPQATAANATPTTPTTGPGSSGPAGTAGANSATANGQTPTGAAELNARVVVGAASLTAQPNLAVNASNALMKPSDPNAGAIPPAAAATVPPTGKTQPPSGIAPAKSDGSALASVNPSPDQAAQIHNAVTAADRTDTPTHDTSSNPQGNNPNQQPAGTADPSTIAASAAATLSAQQSSSPSSPTIATPTTTLPAAYMAVPASDQVAAQLKQAIKIGANEIQIQLKPATLGSIDVKLNVTHDGRLTAVISADRSDTLNLLRQDSGNLQQALRDAGFNADGSSLSFNLSGGDAQTSQQNASQQQRSLSSSAMIGAIDAAPSRPIAAYASRQHNGSVDIQV